MKNLLLYELVLLIAGAVLFLALVFALIFCVIKNKPLKNIFWFFVFPIIMIGFPSIESLSFANGMFEINKLTAEVKNNPTDEAKRKELGDAIAAINPERIKLDADASKDVAKAHLELGNVEESEQAIQNALALQKNDPEAIRINNQINETKAKDLLYKENVEKLDKILDKAGENNNFSPKDITAIKGILNETEVPKYTDEKSQIIIAKSLSKLGDKQSSSKIAESVLEKNPDSQEAILIKRENLLKKDTIKFKLNTNKFERAIIKNQ